MGARYWNPHGSVPVSISRMEPIIDHECRRFFLCSSIPLSAESQATLAQTGSKIRLALSEGPVNCNSDMPVKIEVQRPPCSSGLCVADYAWRFLENRSVFGRDWIAAAPKLFVPKDVGIREWRVLLEKLYRVLREKASAMDVQA